MPHEAAQALSRPVLNSIAAQLYVAESKCHAISTLGSASLSILSFVYGDLPFYGQVSHDHAHLALRVVDGPVFAGDVRQREHLLSASLTVATSGKSSSSLWITRQREFTFIKR